MAEGFDHASIVEQLEPLEGSRVSAFERWIDFAKVQVCRGRTSGALYVFVPFDLREADVALVRNRALHVWPEGDVVVVRSPSPKAMKVPAFGRDEMLAPVRRKR